MVRRALLGGCTWDTSDRNPAWNAAFSVRDRRKRAPSPSARSVHFPAAAPSEPGEAHGAAAQAP
jgi:hypothetical protein